MSNLPPRAQDWEATSGELALQAAVEAWLQFIACLFNIPRAQCLANHFLQVASITLGMVNPTTDACVSQTIWKLAWSYSIKDPSTILEDLPFLACLSSWTLTHRNFLAARQRGFTHISQWRTEEDKVIYTWYSMLEMIVDATALLMITGSPQNGMVTCKHSSFLCNVHRLESTRGRQPCTAGSGRPCLCCRLLCQLACR